MRIVNTQNTFICKAFTIIHNYSQNFLKIAINSLVGVLYRAQRKRADGLLPNILIPAFEIG